MPPRASPLSRLLISVCVPQLGEMVNLHFLSLMEALAECNASTLARLLPVWTQVFYAYNEQVRGALASSSVV